MWNNYSLISEMLGMFVLVFGVIASNRAADKLKLEGYKKGMFSAICVGISLMLAVYLAEIEFSGSFKGNVHGYVNPAVALMHAVGTNVWDFFLPSLVGELLGAVVAALVMVVFKYAVEGTIKTPKAENETLEVRESIFGEMIGSIIFLGGVAIAVWGGTGAALSGIIVGLSVMLALMGPGQRFPLLLNPAVGIGLYVQNTIETKAFSVVSLQTYALTLMSNLAVASVIGAVYYGLGQM